MEFSVYGKKYAKRLDTNLLPSFHLHCYRQVASILTLISAYFVKLLLVRSLGSIETRKLHVRIVVQRLILRVTRRHVQLEHCIVPNVPTSSQNPKTI